MQVPAPILPHVPQLLFPEFRFAVLCLVRVLMNRKQFHQCLPYVFGSVLATTPIVLYPHHTPKST